MFVLVICNPVVAVLVIVLGRAGRQGASGERRAALAKGTRSRARGINPEPIRPMCHIAMLASSNAM